MTHVGIRSINSKRDLSTRARMNELWNSGEEILCTAEGVVYSQRPSQRLAKTLESIHERGQDTSCSIEKLSIKVQHPQKPLESRLFKAEMAVECFSMGKHP